MPRFYLPQNFQLEEYVELPENVSRHIQVLRMQPGSVAELFDGSGRVYSCVIHTMHRKHVGVVIQSEQYHSYESPLHTILIQSISANERMDWVMQKATELGVNHIVPIVTERSNYKRDAIKATKKLQRWQDIVIAACEQCNRTIIPTIDSIRNLSDGLDWLPESHRRIALGFEKNKLDLAQEQPEGVVLFIGPEGGLSRQEYQYLGRYDFQVVSLGARVLRTETAAVAALSIVQAAWGDMASSIDE